MPDATSTTTVAVNPTTASTTASTTVKKGYQTSEFYFSAVALLIGVLYASGVISAGTTADKIAGLACSLLATLGYTVSRSALKASSAK